MASIPAGTTVVADAFGVPEADGLRARFDRPGLGTFKVYLRQISGLG